MRKPVRVARADSDTKLEMTWLREISRFLRLIRRRWARGSYSRHASHRDDPYYDDDGFDFLSSRRSKRDRRKRIALRRAAITRAATILLYVGLATYAASKITGRTPLEALQGTRAERLLERGAERASRSALLRGTRFGASEQLHSDTRRAYRQVPVKEINEILDDAGFDGPRNSSGVSANIRKSGSDSASSGGEEDESNTRGRDGHAPRHRNVVGEKPSSARTEEDEDADADDEEEDMGKKGASSTKDATGKASFTYEGEVRPVSSDISTRRCYMSGLTEDSVCVHTPLCVRSTGVVYVAEKLKCAAYSNVHGIMGTLSPQRCVDIERDLESRADIVDPEHKSLEWISGLERDGHVHWIEGETVFLILSPHARSVSHFAQRIFMLHHILLHPQRYGMDRVSNVVIIADKEVVRKIKFHKSWQNGLLSAIVHPSKPVFKYSQMKSLLDSGKPAPGSLLVFVTSGPGEFARGHKTPCFRRAAVPSALRSQYLLAQDQYPGVVSHGVPSGSGDSAAVAAARRHGKFFDGAMFRKQLFASLDRDEPLTQRKLVYLHRAKGRKLSRTGRAKLEDALREVAKELHYEYAVINPAGMSFREQVEAMSGVSIAVGVHGMQLMSSLFMSGDGGLVEIFPYKFWHDLYKDGCGAGLLYQSMSLSSGDEFPDLGSFSTLDACITNSVDCRMWYRSDNRDLSLNDVDAREVQRMVREAAIHVARFAGSA